MTCMRSIMAFYFIIIASYLPAQQIPQRDSWSAAQKNAALVYWQAFALMPEITNEQAQAIDKSNGVLTKDLKTVLSQSQPSLNTLMLATRRSYCEWGIPEEEGPMTLLPHAQKARNLGRLACLKVHADIHLGEEKAAIETLIAVFKLARHMNSDEIAVSTLVGYAIERRAITTIAVHLNQLEKSTLTFLQTELKTLPGQITLDRIILGEKRLFWGWFVNAMQTARTDKSEMNQLTKLLGVKIQNTALLELTDTEFLKHADAAGKVYDELAKMMTKHPDELKKYEDSRSWSKLLAGNPLKNSISLLIPSFSGLRYVEAEMTIRMHMLAAAIEIVQSRKTTINDPVSKSPFNIVQTKSGFSLESKFKKRNNEPIIQAFGKP